MNAAQILDTLNPPAPDSAEPADRTTGIAVIGAGAIVRAAHLPAYTAAGLRVLGVADKDPARADALAADFALPRRYADLAAVLADPDAAVVDIAVDPHSQQEVARAALDAGRDVLCQKPLAEDYPAAAELVAHADKRGAVLAVNQQMRWEPLVAAAKALIDGGAVGEVVDLLIDLDVWTDWGSWPWMAARPRLELHYHSIHHFDTARHLLGDPLEVSCVLDRYPAQAARGESCSTTHIRFAGGARATVRADHNNWSGDDARAVLRVRGTEGRIDGTLGLLYDYPHGRPDTLNYRHRDGTALQRTLPGSWVPDAFAGPMLDLLRARRGAIPEPLTSGRANLPTVALVAAAYLSDAQGRRVTLDEVS